MFERKVNMVYYISSKLGRRVTFTKAKQIASSMSIEKLDRIYKSLTNR